MTYHSSDGKRSTLTEAMGTSSTFLGIVSPDYLKDLCDKDSRVRKELKACKEFNVNIILLYFDNLSPDERKFAEDFFKSYRVIRTYQIPHELDKCDEWFKEHLSEIEQAIKDSSP